MASLIEQLLSYVLEKGLMEPEDRIWAKNEILAVMGWDGDLSEEREALTLAGLLSALTEAAVAEGTCHDDQVSRDLFDTRLMGALTPHPAMVREKFSLLNGNLGPRKATDWFYQLCRDVDYIKVDRIAKNARFFQDTPAGRLEITINLSKPEKDPRDIAAQRSAAQTARFSP